MKNKSLSLGILVIPVVFILVIQMLIVKNLSLQQTLLNNLINEASTAKIQMPQNQYLLRPECRGEEGSIFSETF